MAGPCRLCAANDREALIEHIAAYMWDSRVQRMVEDIPWDNAGATWQTSFRELAIAAVQSIEQA